MQMGLKRQHGLALTASTRLRSSHPCILCAPNILASCTFCETKLSFSKETKATLAPPRRGADKQGPRPAVDKQRGPAPPCCSQRRGPAPPWFRQQRGPAHRGADKPKGRAPPWYYAPEAPDKSAAAVLTTPPPNPVPQKT